MGFEACTKAGNLDVDILLARQEIDSRQPILAADGLSRITPRLRWQNPTGRGEGRPGDLSPERTGSNLHLRIISQALELSRIPASHDVETVLLFAKPDWSPYRCAALSKRRQ